MTKLVFIRQGSASVITSSRLKLNKTISYKIKSFQVNVKLDIGNIVMILSRSSVFVVTIQQVLSQSGCIWNKFKLLILFRHFQNCISWNVEQNMGLQWCKNQRLFLHYQICFSPSDIIIIWAKSGTISWYAYLAKGLKKGWHVIASTYNYICTYIFKYESLVQVKQRI